MRIFLQYCRGLRLACLLLPMLMLASGPARADTAIAQTKSYRGNINFVGTEVTMRTSAGDPCAIRTTGVSATLKGLPTGASILSAQLYWTGSGTRADYDIAMDGKALSATRRYTSTTIGSGFTFFSGSVDVTSAVSAKGNATYNFTNLDINNGSPWCAASGVVGGFALLVIYSHPNEPTRMLNLYEGFQYVRNSTLTINLSNFLVPNPLDAAMTGRIGHITWEGDALTSGSEDVLFNNVALTDATNPSGNQFNSASNINGDTRSYGIDFDAYVVKSPTIKAGDTTAVTTFRSGSDLVLLSAEVVALPYILSSDLLLEMIRNGDLVVGTNATYTIKVSNKGLDAEAGPVTVIDTIPAGLRFISAVGDKWTCTSAAQSSGATIVTCTQPGPVESNAAMTPLVITVSPTRAGTFTNEAVVSGKTSDNNTGNNKAADTASGTDPGSMPFVYTTRACKDGEAISYNGEAGCPAFSASSVIAASNVPLFLTAVTGATAKATAFSATLKTDKSLQFAATCLPSSSVKVAYAGLNLACDGTASAAQTVSFAAGQPSASLANNSQLVYSDVGMVKVFAKFSGKDITANFISRPQDVRLFDVVRASDDYPDRNVASDNTPLTDPATLPDIAFAKAGELFKIRIGATMANGGWAPSFGKEGKETAIPSALKAMTPKLTVDRPAALDAALPHPYVPEDNFTLSASDSTTGAGLMVGTARWFEAGLLVMKLTSLSNYLGTGEVKAGGSANPRWVGRFYPDHYTVALTSNFKCVADMACPADDPSVSSYDVGGATYSRQPFTAAVSAYAMAVGDEDPMLMTLYQDVVHKQTDASYKQPIASTLVLGAYRAPMPPQDSAKDPTQGWAPADRDKADFTGFTVTQPIPGPTPGDAYPMMQALVSYQLMREFNYKDARAVSPWSKPTPIYVRATAYDTIRRKNTVTAIDEQKQVVISSLPGPGGDRYEDGILVLAGRTKVGNVFGSQARRVPVQLQAEYWNGTAWLINKSDLSTSIVGTAISMDTCTRKFLNGSVCNIGLLSAASSNGVAFPADADRFGKATLMLSAPGPSYYGAVDFHLTGGNADKWLPSTTARASFGLANSPLIYIREVY